MSNKYFCLDENNFHKVSTFGKNFFNAITYGAKQVEYEQSDFYIKLCNKLYKDGLIQIEYLKELLDKNKKEIIISKDKIREKHLNRIERNFKNKNDIIDKYQKQVCIDNLDENVNKEYNNNVNKLENLKRRLEVTEYVFGNGFEHFMVVTKKYGNKINNIEYIKNGSLDYVTFSLNVFESFFKINI